jgi:acylaminoacyl-peptidase
VTPEDLLRFRIVSDPQIAPDGSRIVFVEKCVGPKNAYVHHLWMVTCGAGRPHSRPLSHPVASDRRAREAFQFTDGRNDTSPRWSPDGKQIAFLRQANGQEQIYAISASGGESRQVSRLPEGSIRSFRWSPNGRQLAVSFRPEDPQRTDEARRDRKDRGLSEPPLVVESLRYRCDGDGYFGARRHALYLVDAVTGSHRLLYGEDRLGEFSFDFSPNSRQLVVATNRDPEPTIHPEKDELLRIDVATGRMMRLPGLPLGPKASVRWSPDGRTIAYAGRIGTDPLYSPDNADLFVCDAVRGGARNLTAEEDICLQAEGIVDTGVAFGDPALQFSPDGRRVYLRLSIRGESHVASVAVNGGRLVFHTRGAVDVRMGNVSADGRKMALTIGSAVKLAEVAMAECRPGAFRPKRLTDLNGPMLDELQLAVPERHWIRDADGHHVHVSVIKPPVLDSTGSRKKVPAVLEIHGGPHAQYCSTFFHEFQLLASAGYAVFYANPRGSKGYGREHCAAIRGQWGTADWTDIQAVTAFMKQQPYVDCRRMGVMGGSYGGYMTNWAISHCHDFAAAVTDRCLSNLVSWSGSSDLIEPVNHYYSGNFWDQPEARWEQSPMKYLGNVKTPTLVIHSEGDLRCNIEQAEQLFTALKLLGVPTRFLRYPANTSHAMSRNGPPDLRVHRLYEILAWLKRYLDHSASAKAAGNRKRATAQ